MTLKDAIAEMGWTRDAAAERLSMSVAALNGYVSGKKKSKDLALFMGLVISVKRLWMKG